jgi:formiminotetrahydrofolate cyclodeaminase
LATTDRLGRLLEAIASKEPAPASGSASAAVVAAAAALLEKCARLSARRWAGSAEALEQAHALRVQSEELVEHDVRAYLGFVEAVRSQAGLEDAHARTVGVPLEIARAAVKVSLLAEQLAEHGNPKLRADAVVAAILASAAAESAAFLVDVNLGPGHHVRSAEAQALALQASDLSRKLRVQGS